MKKMILAALIAAFLTTGCGGAAGLGVLTGISAVETVGGIAAMGNLYEQNKKMAEARDRQFKSISQSAASKKAEAKPEQKQADALDDIERAAEAKQ